MVNELALYMVFGVVAIMALIALWISLMPGPKKGKVVH